MPSAAVPGLVSCRPSGYWGGLLEVTLMLGSWGGCDSRGTAGMGLGDGRAMGHLLVSLTLGGALDQAVT